MMTMRHATLHDEGYWRQLDEEMQPSEYTAKVRDHRCYVLALMGEKIGIMRYNLCWDKIPFITLLKVQEQHRYQGYGAQALRQWEEEMHRMGHPLVLVSTPAQETAQHFFRKQGYRDAGSLMLDLPGEGMELFLQKRLTPKLGLL